MEIQLRDEKTISSLDLVKEINIFKQKEFEYKKENGLKLGKVEEKNGRYTDKQSKFIVEKVNLLEEE